MNDDQRRAGLRRERARASAQFGDGKFKNPSGATPALKGPSLPVMGEYFFRRGRRTPPGPLPLERPHEAWARPASTGLRATWLGHSSVLLEIDGRRVLTDPVFGERASPLRIAGPKRFHPVPVAVDELPPLDAVLVSHDHFDHLCRPTIEALARSRVPIVTALGVGAHLESFGVDPRVITELDWHESAEVKGLRFTATPSQHFSGRGLTDRNDTLWASWALAGDRRKVFFSGDTGLMREFVDIGRLYGPFDLVMLEVGAYHPSWGDIHLGPENALVAFERLGGGTLLPVHWGTFNLALHDWDEPAETLLRLAAERGQRIVTPRIGAAFEPDHVEAPTPWWRSVVAASAKLPSALPRPALERPPAGSGHA
ncbi:MAG TPA: MBL fold metallo-hydrolase [Polyangiaceae bacterium]|nr:MBL fold metallo-hydrolase [Polyangiaceae bacterium]